jgi:hypothetical protein
MQAVAKSIRAMTVCSWGQALLPMQASSIAQRGIERLYRASAACLPVAQVWLELVAANP